MIASSTIKTKSLPPEKDQKFIGRPAFFARFIKYGGELFNSTYDEFAGAHKIQCTVDLVMVTEEM